MAGIFSEDRKQLDPPRIYYFRLRREFDRSGSLNLGPQTPGFAPKPDARYRCKVGCLVLDDALGGSEKLSSDRLLRRMPPADVWARELDELDDARSMASFRTLPGGPGGERLSFLLGSCRYPGLLWKARQSDEIFGPMAELARRDEDPDAPRLLLMAGDQIYADPLSRFAPMASADSYAEFRDRYLTAFGTPNLRALMSSVPTYMILDDHEIEDNWSQDRLRRSSRRQLFTIAIDAYLSYQWSHGPRTWGKRLYYRFSAAGFPFFVLDTRTQRHYEGKKGELSRNHLLGHPTLAGAPPGQLARLLRWLVEQQGRRGDAPKFVVTSSAFLPNPVSARTVFMESDPEAVEGSDSWPAFPETRAAILSRIVDYGIQNVVFLCGDIHCSVVAQADFEGAEDLRLFSVTSSAFYWPFPFADGEPSDYVHDSRKAGQEDGFSFQASDGRAVTMHYKAKNFSQEDNFAHITVDRKTATLRVRVRDKRGKVVTQDEAPSYDRTLDASLRLTRW